MVYGSSLRYILVHRVETAGSIMNDVYCRFVMLSNVLYRVNIKKYSPTTFVDISAMRGDFCMKFYRTVKQSNIHFITKFG